MKKYLTTLLAACCMLAAFFHACIGIGVSL